MSHGCNEWVWLKDRACTNCLADGRPDEGPYPEEDIGGMTRTEEFGVPQDVYVPQLKNGTTLLYTLMQLAASSDFDNGWTVKQVPIPIFPTTPECVPPKLTTTAELSATNVSQGGQNWTNNEGDLE